MENTSVQPLNFTSNDLRDLRIIMNQIEYFICPTLLVIGLTGNICTILTVTRSRFRNMASRHILCVLAVSDSLLLCTNPFNQNFMKDLWGRDIRTFHESGCKLFFVMYRVGKISASWFIVLVAVERFLAVVFPLKAKVLLHKKIIYIAIACVYVGVFSFAGTWTFSTTIVNSTCLPDYTITPSAHGLHRCFVVAAACAYCIVPISVLLTLTPPIVIKLLRNHRLREKMNHSAISRSARETSRISMMPIGICLSYVIWVTPITFVLVITLWNNQPIFDSTDVRMYVFQTIALIFEQLNHSSNFIIYVMSSVQFRRRFFAMIGLRKFSLKETGAVTSSSVSVVSSKS